MHPLGGPPQTFVIHYEGPEGFYAMPQEVRSLGMWTDIRRGDVVMLKPEYRLALARQNYVLIENAPLGWQQEVG